MSLLNGPLGLRLRRVFLDPVQVGPLSVVLASPDPDLVGGFRHGTDQAQEDRQHGLEPILCISFGCNLRIKPNYVHNSKIRLNVFFN
jgi:hypothetical protein